MSLNEAKCVFQEKWGNIYYSLCLATEPYYNYYKKDNMFTTISSLLLLVFFSRNCRSSLEILPLLFE